MASHSHHVLVSSNLVPHGHGSVSWESSSESESSVVWKWVGDWLRSLGRDQPSLVGSVMAVVPADWSVVGVSSTVDVQALASHVSQVSSSSSEPCNLLEDFISEGSDDSVSSDSVALTDHGRDGESSVGVNSDGSRSGVEGEPLVVVSWVVVPDSQQLLTFTHVAGSEEGSVAAHS